ncbi:manganese transporter [Pseudomonas putida]|uniref:Nramp family divalent metal transporter n=1 Tax=Pseudomonas putida TaxID=303 RepID=UPI0007B6E2E7|nr:Nramp family divalent metal transporter [Pseudomonas putida]ANC04045.1 manganese transporter [Pseudomonas putida]
MSADAISREASDESASGEPTSPILVNAPRKRWFTFMGAGSLIAVGYMDPGNWATALGSGSKYGYELLSVVLIASLMGLLLQRIAAKVGVITGRDLAQLCRERCGKRTNIFLWVTCEISIIACDVAEVVGSAVALQLLFGISLTSGVLISAVATLVMLLLQIRSQRPLQVAISFLILLIGICFVIQLSLANPQWGAVAGGLVPSPELLRDAGMVWLAAGILGATVMPHNLYLHSALVKQHGVGASEGQVQQILKGVNVDTTLSLGVAFTINAALLIVAAAVFNVSGHTEVNDLADAHRLISPLLGNQWASILFASALLACGINATVTGTLAGQVVMEGFLKLKMALWARALLTRGLAIGPALLCVGVFGDNGSNELLVASQVVLSLQLPLAVIPLVAFAASKELMGKYRIRGGTWALARLCSSIIVLLNFVLLAQILSGE